MADAAAVCVVDGDGYGDAIIDMGGVVWVWLQWQRCNVSKMTMKAVRGQW